MEFTQEEFFQMLTKYHNAVWPMAWILFFIGIGMLAVLLSRWHFKRPVILGALSFIWLWCGTIFLGYFCSGYISHTTFVPDILLFSLQGLLFLIAAVRSKAIDFDFSGIAYEIVGIVWICFSLIGWPLIGNISGHFYTSFPVFGEPCPITIFTFGVLLCSKTRVPWYFMLLPFIWSLTGVIGLIQLGMSDDFIEFVVGMSATVMILIRNRSLARRAI
jgi:hypothetical protein